MHKQFLSRPLGPVPQQAFTRTELTALTALLSLLLAVVLPALAHDRARSSRIICANNLRQIGSAIQIWGNDHGELPPWDVATGDGGTKGHPLAVNVWFHLSWMSNEMNSARILLCPSDDGVAARDFSPSPDGGYVHSNYRSKSTSYLLVHSSTLVAPGIRAADRNVGFDGNDPSGCPNFGSALRFEANRRPYRGRFQWGTNVHRAQGNVLASDGGVVQLSNEELREQVIQFPQVDGGVIHFITPR